MMNGTKVQLLTLFTRLASLAVRPIRSTHTTREAADVCVERPGVSGGTGLFRRRCLVTIKQQATVTTWIITITTMVLTRSAA